MQRHTAARTKFQARLLELRQQHYNRGTQSSAQKQKADALLNECTALSRNNQLTFYDMLDSSMVTMRSLFVDEPARCLDLAKTSGLYFPSMRSLEDELERERGANRHVPMSIDNYLAIQSIVPGFELSRAFFRRSMATGGCWPLTYGFTGADISRRLRPPEQ